MTLNAALVSQLFGGSAGGVGMADAGSAIVNLRRALAPGAETKGIAAERKDPITLSALGQFKAALSKADTLDKALADPRVQAVLLPALGLASQVGNTGLVRQALQSDPKDPNGLASRLGSNWRNAAATLNLKEGGLATLQDPATQQKLIDGFVQYQYRSGLDEQTAGLSDALYFIEQAKNTKDVYDLLGNTVIRRVVTGALGLPAQIAVQPVETQGRAVASRLDVDKLQDPREVRKLADRYLVAAAGSNVSGGNSYLSALFR